MAFSADLRSGRHIATPRPGGLECKYEVHFPKNYVQYNPWGWGDIPCQLPVSRLCHATHVEQAIEILENDLQCRFQVHRKYGKSYDDPNHYGESHCYTPKPENKDVPGADTECYHPIPDDTPIFPGYYSWWGLAVDQPPTLPWIESKYLPPYLKSPPESVYGDIVFSSNLCDLLQSYATSRGCGLGDIYLKVGGTLRYKREIAYVIIVCTSDDLEALNSYDSITHTPPGVFDPSGLVDCNGKVIDMARVPRFTTHYMNTYVSYETLNFAFHFSKEEDFRCHSDTIEVSEIKHEFCIRSKPMATWFDRNTMKFTIKQICNQMPENQEKHDRAIRFARRYDVEWREMR